MKGIIKKLTMVCIAGIWCLSVSNSAENFTINSGITGTWYNQATSGQGMLLEVLPSSQQIFMAWFSFSADANNQGQEWWTAIGGFQNDTSALTVYQTNGGFFNRDSEIENIAVGQVTLKFIDCDHALMNFEFTSKNTAGQIELTRLVPDNLCSGLTDE